MKKLTKRILVENSISADIKVFAKCWEAVAVSVHEDFDSTIKFFENCLEKSCKIGV